MALQSDSESNTAFPRFTLSRVVDPIIKNWKYPVAKTSHTHTHMTMGTKNISISDDVYLRLRRARRHPRESFSQVIRRGHWEDDNPTAQAWLDSFDDVPHVAETILDELEANQKTDRLPEDKWSC